MTGFQQKGLSYRQKFVGKKLRNSKRDTFTADQTTVEEVMIGGASVRSSSKEYCVDRTILLRYLKGTEEMDRVK